MWWTDCDFETMQNSEDAKCLASTNSVSKVHVVTQDFDWMKQWFLMIIEKLRHL